MEYGVRKMAEPFDWSDLLSKASKARGTTGRSNPELLTRLLVAKETNNVGSIDDILRNSAYNSKVYGGEGVSSGGLFLKNPGYLDPDDYKMANPEKASTIKAPGEDLYKKYTAPGYIDQLLGGPSGVDIGSVLSQQANKFRSTLDAGRQRGQYNPSAYGAGIAELEKQFTAARPLAQDMVSGIYQEPKSSIADLLTEAGKSRDKDKGKFDFNPFKEKIDTIAGDFSGTANDRVTNALNTSDFFTMPNVRNAIANTQGAGNASSPDLMRALMEQRQRQGTTRGLGNQGGL
jgi:hypothetical protein